MNAVATAQAPTVALRVALVGSPNCGKSTLFNALTGLRAKTGNYPGVTVDRRVGRVQVPGRAVDVIDLPGLYSLHAVADDEVVALRVLRGELAGERPVDATVFVADATTLARSLPLLAEVLELGLPTLVVLTMVDELKARGGELDLFQLQRALGVQVLGVVGNRGLGLDDLRIKLAEPERWKRPQTSEDVMVGPEDVASAAARFAWADRVLGAATRRSPRPHLLTRRLDSVLLHPVLGLVVFLLFCAGFFQAIFSWAAPLMDAMSAGMEGAADWLAATLPPGWATDLLANGIVRGVGAVVVFVPQIAILFAMILLCEASGYMARAAFVVDRAMGWFGLEGRCFIALLSSYACAVPGILATRSIPSPRHRLATILVAPFATCSARLPVYALLITAVIPPTPILGWFTLQGLTLFGLYVLGGVTAVVFAALFQRGLRRGQSLPFYLELPPYRWPSLRSIALQTWRRVLSFLRDAGTVILAGSVVLWFLLNFPRTEVPAGSRPAERQRIILEQSYAADVGRALAPVFAPMGFDWRINVGLVGSFAARELMVSTLAQVYAYNADPDDEDGTTRGLAELLRTPDPSTGKPPLSVPSAFALMAFTMYALLCLSTVAAVKRETGGYKWPVFMVAYMFALAWVAGFVTYRLAS
ncbi:MAG: ferrous iron transporter B [Planctomycetota bacterium]